jgi:hypothetical protein
MQPGIGMTYGLNRRVPVDTAPIPEEDDRAAQMPQCSEEPRHVDGLEVVRLPAAVQPHVLPCWRDGEGSQRREAVMRVVVAVDRRVPGRRPSAAACGDEEKTALI